MAMYDDGVSDKSRGSSGADRCGASVCKWSISVLL